MGKSSVRQRPASIDQRTSVLIMSDCYLPGFKGGGPIRSLVNLVSHLGEELDFKVITRDRDLGDPQPYLGISRNSWQRMGNARVMYLTPKSLSFHSFTRLVREAATDLVYLNSLFSPTFTIQYLLGRRMGLFPDVPTVLAPRGELSPGALSIKPLKKRVYLAVSKVLKLYDGVFWHASSDHEAKDIRRCFGDRVSLVVAPALPSVPNGMLHGESGRKIPGRLKVIFLSRISRMKNLVTALAVLARTRGEIDFHIYGPLEDAEYWAECQRLIATMPPNVRVEYRGSVAHERIFDIMKEYQLFFLPTLGENYGHVIVEALSSGCPVLISDRTPWRNLEAKGVGWDIPLEQPDRLEAALQQALGMDADTHVEWSRKAQALGRSLQQDQVAVAKSRNLFATAMDSVARG